MQLKHKIIIGSGTCVALALVVIFLDLPSYLITGFIIIMSIIVTFLGLAYYEEQQEKNEVINR